MKFEDVVARHAEGFIKRGRRVMAAEHMPATGQAYLWHQDVIQQVPDCGKKVAHQIARLCSDDSQVAITWRDLADAVGEYDKTGQVAYVQRGTRMLTDVDWLYVRTIGEKRGATTTFYLMAGEDTEYKKRWDEGFYDGSDWHDHHVA